jgi:7-cyano-7-deazaguanine tRNA-ribosyltransferase
MEVRERDGLARIAKFRGVETPTLMPVVNPNKIVISPKEMMENFGVEAIITNSYIIWKTPSLREKALKEGLHEMLDFPGLIMTDSGTFQQHVYGDVEVTNREILEFQRDIGSDIGTMLDVFTEPHFTKEEVKRAIDETFLRGKEATRLKGDMLLAGPIQGSIYPDLRAYAARKMNRLDFDYFPIGGVVPLMEEYRYAEVAEAVVIAKKYLDPSKPVHLFGAGHPMFFPLAALLGVDFFDSAAYIKYARDNRLLFPDGTRHLKDVKYPPYFSPALERHDLEEIMEMGKEERSRILAEHNLYVSMEEIRRIKEAIHEERIWEYAESRARGHPTLLKAYRRILRYRRFLEKFEPKSRKGAFFYSGPESMSRPFVLGVKRRLKVFAQRDLILKIPRPWSTNLERIPKDAAVLTPFGAVPLELEDTYPFAQSEFPVDERMHVPENYEGIEPQEFEIRKIRAIADFQFGEGASNALFNGNLKILKSKNTGKIRNVVVDGEHVVSLRAEDGLFTLKLHGAIRLHRAFEFPRMRVVVNDDSAEFNRQGRNVFSKFVLDCDDDIRPSDEVLIVNSRDELLAVGKAILNCWEMKKFTKGMCVKTREGVDRPKSGLVR